MAGAVPEMSRREAAHQARKLGLVEGSRVVLVDAPPDWSLDEPPAGAVVARLNAPFGPDEAADLGSAELTIVFARDASSLAATLDAVTAAGMRPAPLWICWPRRAGGHESDLSDGVVRRAGLALGLVDNKVAAVDADWSGLRFVLRRDRA
jgi:hypothetical protein